MVKTKNKRVPMKKLITSINPKSLVSEQYRTLRTNINFSSPDRDIRSIVVTSAAHSEGKSTTAANLAIVYAQEGKKVLLIDGDLRKPTMHYIFSIKNTVGLSSVLVRQNTLENVISTTEIENLDLITSGPLPPNPVELLGSKSLEALLKKLEESYDVLIIDTPPILAVADGQVLANRCEGAILVINSGETVKEDAIKAKELIMASNSRLIGAVLNNFKLPSTSYYGNYYESEEN
ncbi:CpsD/CapB family tyrosine-protein kinase [Planococcus shenhongbingii]|uniref:CpsD/CapB family tyrosine-protein kinase n=1 Tax=Planococcus shenhongbingii TaxID=3058398 RepID=UPI00262563A1|nr:CpsD/CapB family tyrosine-protein kinase [Planococcus sp. N016]WKA57744.1 CpsD/CapB family tyrosine-protein kinase [Planococcus sp. N016]